MGKKLEFCLRAISLATGAIGLYKSYRMMRQRGCDHSDIVLKSQGDGSWLEVCSKCKIVLGVKR